VETGRAISLVVPVASNQDYNLHQYAEAEPLLLEKLSASERPPRVLDNASASGCARAGEFLGAVSQLADAAVKNHKAPQSLCYVYDAQINTLTLERVEPVPQLDVKVNSAKGWDSEREELRRTVAGRFRFIASSDGKARFLRDFAGDAGSAAGRAGANPISAELVVSGGPESAAENGAAGLRRSGNGERGSCVTGRSRRPLGRNGRSKAG
jgi:hypothetical protein